MQTLRLGIRWCFEALDDERRRRGATMDRLGYGPDETPSETVFSTPGLRLRFYGGSRAASAVALIIPAPIKRHYIWDMTRESSVIQQALQADIKVYLIEWTDPGDTEEQPGLEEYGSTLIAACVQAISEAQHTERLFLLSHSLGGVFAAIYAALHPEQVAGLVLIEAPLHFGKASGSFGPLVSFGPRAGAVARMFGRVPGSVLSLASVLASPATFNLERYADFFASLGSSKNIRSHLLVERWTLDEAPMTGPLFEQVVDQLYREDRLMRGVLTIAGQRIGPQRVVSPLLSVYAPHSVVIPPASVRAFFDAAGSAKKRLLAYHGDTGVAIAHVGALVGENAHRLLWPEILGWVAEVAASGP